MHKPAAIVSVGRIDAHRLTHFPNVPSTHRLSRAFARLPRSSPKCWALSACEKVKGKVRPKMNTMSISTSPCQRRPDVRSGRLGRAKARNVAIKRPLSLSICQAHADTMVDPEQLVTDGSRATAIGETVMR